MESLESNSTGTQNRITISIPGGALVAVIHLPRILPAAAVVCCHGMLSSKDSSKFCAVANHLSATGWVAVRFDFSGAGESQAAFLGTLLATRLRDLQAVIAYVREQPWTDGRLALLGSSLGGFLALLAASQDDYIQALVCWASPFDLRPIRLAMETGRPLPPPFPPDLMLGTPQDLAMLPPIPGVLIIHGQDDEIVSWHDAGHIYGRLGDPKQLLLFENADHRFLDPGCRELAIKASAVWLQERLIGNAGEVR